MSSKKSHVFLHASLRLQRGLLGVLGHHIIILDMIHSINFIISLPSSSTTSQIVHRTIKLLGQVVERAVAGQTRLAISLN